MKRIKDHQFLYRRGDVLHFRRSVPPSARHVFEGRREVWVSLGTCSVPEARHLLAVEIAKFERLIAQATKKIAPIDVAIPPLLGPTQPEIGEAVREWFADRAERIYVDFRSDSSESVRREEELEAVISHLRNSIRGHGDPPLDTQWVAEEIIQQQMWKIDPGAYEYSYLLRLVGRGQIEAAERHLREIRGLPHRIVDDTFSPEQYIADDLRRQRRVKEEPVSLHALFDGYAAERKPSPATIKAWKRQLRAFTDFLEHDDARRVTGDDVVRWKDYLLNRPERPLSAKTVADTYLSAIKTTFRWGLDNNKVKENPVTVRVRKPKRQKIREAGLTAEEAITILRGTLLPTGARLSAERALAQRWVPWICAYTGARVNEITQLRAEDVMEVSGCWAIRITPEAGSVKDGKLRVVALHPHIIEQGFLAAIEGNDGHLFFDPKRKRGGSDENPQSKKVGEFLARWVRSLGVTDLRVQPNHGWRHRFTTNARTHRMSEEIRHYILGQAYPTQARNYGDITAAMTLREIEMLPRYEVSEAR
ncbi:MAG: DUF6538 domain-containing protein [Sphingobium sp.]